MERRTKIICTLGPASKSPEAIGALVAAGMDVARINFSHGALDEHEERIERVREASRSAGRPVAILADLPGPKIRIGELPEPVRLQPGDAFSLMESDGPGDAHRVHLPSVEVFRSVHVGDSLFIDDGLIELQIVEMLPGEIRTQVLSGGQLSSHKGLAAPGVRLDTPSLTDADRVALAFIVSHDIDWVAASFVRAPEDVLAVREVLETAGRPLPIIAKIEKSEAVEQLEGVLDASDGLMVARGDLGVEVPIYQVPLLQKRIISMCNAAGKPAITATQMLDSMIRNPRPTRAEVTDVANAVLDGADCVMLSGETAVGLHPVEAVRLMRQIVREAEGALDPDRFIGMLTPSEAERVTDSISLATCRIASELNAAAILTATSSGHTARMVSRHRPRTPIIGVASDPRIYNRLALMWGVRPVLTPGAANTDETLERAVGVALANGFVKPGDLVVITAGVPTGIAGNTNLIKVHRVGQPMVDRRRTDPGA